MPENQQQADAVETDIVETGAELTHQGEPEPEHTEPDSPEEPAPSLELLHDLRACLPDIHFSPKTDPQVPLAFLADTYLNYYNIAFGGAYFHRWGRVILAPYTVTAHYWLPDNSPTVPEKGMVVLVHGYFDHVGLYGHLIRHLLEQGYGVVGFDLPGHGLSSGERASIESFDHYVEIFTALLALLEKDFACPISAVGQSTGGAILLKYLATTGGVDLARVALLAPLIAPAYWWFNKAVYALTHKRRTGIKRKFTRNSADDAFLEFVERDPLQARYIPISWLGAMKRWTEEAKAMAPCAYPVTIVQGDSDKTLAWKSNLRLMRKKFPHGTIIVVEDAQHHMANEIRPLRERIFEHMGF